MGDNEGDTCWVAESFMCWAAIVLALQFDHIIFENVPQFKGDILKAVFEGFYVTDLGVRSRLAALGALLFSFNRNVRFIIHAASLHAGLLSFSIVCQIVC